MSIKTLFIVVLISSVSCSQNKATTGSISQYSFTLNTVSSDSLKNAALTKDFILGKFEYNNHDKFTKVNPIHASKILYLNKAVYSAFINMFNHAKTDGISLIIKSGTRNFNEQKAIWERKWKKHTTLEPIERAKKILEFSSMPSTSRHHWGTDIDLNSFTNTYFENGRGKSEYEWLLKNANNYGFYQVYTDKATGRTGYNLERWHWSYLPLASKYLVFYNEHINATDIVDFEGSELAKALKIIPDYVNGLSNQSKSIIQN